MYLLNMLGLLNFLPNLRNCHDNVSALRYSCPHFSVRVTRFLFLTSQNPSDVAFNLLTMLTLLPDSVSIELRNFHFAVILAHIDLNFPRGESAVVDADNGN